MILHVYCNTLYYYYILNETNSTHYIETSVFHVFIATLPTHSLKTLDSITYSLQHTLHTL